MTEITTIIVVYGPNENVKKTQKEAFWEKLSETIEDIKDGLIVIRNLNGRVGRFSNQEYEKFLESLTDFGAV